MENFFKKKNTKVIVKNGYTTIIEQQGNKFRSRMIKGVLTDKYDHIKVSRIGTRIDIDLFLKEIIMDGLTKKDRFMMVYSDYKQFKVCTNEENWIYFSDWASHFVPNGFYKWNDRSNENLRHIRWMVFDFELRKSDGSSFAPGEIYEIFRKNTPVTPSFITPSNTKGNYHVYVAHSEMTGHTQSIYLHNRLQKWIINKIGCDPDAVGPAHNFRIPKKGIWYFGLTINDMDQLKEKWVKDLQKEINRDKQHGAVLSFKEHKIWEHDAIQALLNCEFDGSRNHACFTIALLYYALNKPKEECAEFLQTWYYTARYLGAKPFYPSEVRKAIKSAYSGKYRGPKREFIEGLTGIEFNYNIYGSRKRKKDKRNGDYRNSRNETIQSIVNFLRDNGGEVQMFQKDIIAELKKQGFKERTLKKWFAELRRKETISYTPSHGEHAKVPTFKLGESEIETFKTTIQYDKSYRKQTRYLGELNAKEKEA